MWLPSRPSHKMGLSGPVRSRGAMDPIPSAFAQAIAAQLPRLRRYATALAGNAAVADDLLQDCVERALAREGTLRDAARLGAWLRTILYSIYISAIRTRQRRRTAITVDDLVDDR